MSQKMACQQTLIVLTSHVTMQIAAGQIHNSRHLHHRVTKFKTYASGFQILNWCMTKLCKTNFWVSCASDNVFLLVLRLFFINPVSQILLVTVGFQCWYVKTFCWIWKYKIAYIARKFIMSWNVVEGKLWIQMTWQTIWKYSQVHFGTSSGFGSTFWQWNMALR